MSKRLLGILILSLSMTLAAKNVPENKRVTPKSSSQKKKESIEKKPAKKSFFFKNKKEPESKESTVQGHPQKTNYDSWEPYWISAKYLQQNQNLFFQSSIGAGFLYFSHVQGNFGGTPSYLFTNTGSIPYRSRLACNTTPIFEYQIGYRFFPWLNATFSYQHQGGVTIQSKAINSQNAYVTSGSVNSSQGFFQSDFALDGFNLKGTVEFPWPMIWKLIAYTPYAGVGVGVGWQSWINTTVNLPNVTTGYQNMPLYLRASYNANFTWMADAGIKICSAMPERSYSLLLGCKYNQWGQARNIGKLSKQGSLKMGLFKPFTIRTVYSFAPYLGFRWNISHSSLAMPAQVFDGKCADSWKPFFIDSNLVDLTHGMFSQFNGGIGFLYFSGIRGNLTITPPTYQQNTGQYPGKYSIGYNRTPVLEYLLGIKVNQWVQVGISKQYQSGIFIETHMKPNVNGTVVSHAQLQANLDLLATAVKVYIDIPKTLIWKNFAYSLYLAGGVGPSWQSWTNVGVIQMPQLTPAVFGSNHSGGVFQPLRPKNIPNVFLLADCGIRIRNAVPNMCFNIVAGCKFNYWGSARNLGKVMQQYPNFRQGLFKPFTIKMLYAFVPYLGVQWNFENAYRHSHKEPFIINNHDVTQKFPFIAKVKRLEKPYPLFVELNSGVGFLYFSRIKGNLAGTPASSMNVFGQYPIAGNLSYNRTPLFEYLLGSRIFDWWTACISYQYQSNVNISTQVLKPINPIPGSSNYLAQGSRFIADFRVDALMAKFIFYSPWSIICAGTVNTPYCSAGVGAGWQSWTRVNIERLGANTASSQSLSAQQPLNQTISANVVWVIDFGINVRSAYPGSRFSTTIGVKYNHWGQARSMGKIQDQRGLKEGLFKPISIGLVYSFAPYFGVKWSF